MTEELLADGVGVPLAEGELSEVEVAAEGRRASSEARMRRFVVPEVFVVPDRAEHTRTTRLLLSMAELQIVIEKLSKIVALVLCVCR